MQKKKKFLKVTAGVKAVKDDGKTQIFWYALICYHEKQSFWMLLTAVVKDESKTMYFCSNLKYFHIMGQDFMDVGNYCQSI